MDAFGTAISMSLQYGVPLEVLVNKFSHTRFEPMGHTTNPDVKIAKSVVDYIFRWLGVTFLAGFREANNGTAKLTEGGSESNPTASLLPSAKADGNGAVEQPMDPEVFTSARYHGAGSSNGGVASLAVVEKDSQDHNRDSQFAGFQSDAPSCDNCGAITVRNGNCYLCHNCGNSMGCS